MSLYDYSCCSCGFLWEDVEQSIHDKPKKKCPRCSKMALSRIINLGLPPIVRGDANTLGQLAERNSSKMGKYKLSEERGKYEENIDKVAKERSDDHTKINKMTETQKVRFIENG